MQAPFDIAPIIGGLGSSGLALVIFYFYREDRRAAEDRYAKLVEDLESMIINNTKAITKLDRALTSSRCPYARVDNE